MKERNPNVRVRASDGGGGGCKVSPLPVHVRRQPFIGPLGEGRWMGCRLHVNFVALVRGIPQNQRNFLALLRSVNNCLQPGPHKRARPRRARSAICSRAVFSPTQPFPVRAGRGLRQPRVHRRTQICLSWLSCRSEVLRLCYWQWRGRLRAFLPSPLAAATLGGRAHQHGSHVMQSTSVVLACAHPA